MCNTYRGHNGMKSGVWHHHPHPVLSIYSNTRKVVHAIPLNQIPPYFLLVVSNNHGSRLSQWCGLLVLDILVKDWWVPNLFIVDQWQACRDNVGSDFKFLLKSLNGMCLIHSRYWHKWVPKGTVGTDVIHLGKTCFPTRLTTANP